jgi:uncharacterized protein involved in response to NO
MTRGIFVAIFCAAVMRVLAGFGVWTNGFLSLSAVCWFLAFAAFVGVYGPMLLREKDTAR